jgi:hypothetical protein
LINKGKEYDELKTTQQVKYFLMPDGLYFLTFDLI